MNLFDQYGISSMLATKKTHVSDSPEHKNCIVSCNVDSLIIIFLNAMARDEQPYEITLKTRIKYLCSSISLELLIRKNIVILLKYVRTCTKY